MNFEWSQLLPFLAIAFSLAIALISAKPEETPPYLGPWPWQLIAAIAFVTVIIAQLVFIAFSAFISWILLNDTELNSIALTLISFSWFLAAFASLMMVVVQLYCASRNPTLMKNSTLEELASVAREAEGLLRASKRYAKTGLLVRFAGNPGTPLEIRRRDRHSLVVVVREVFLEEWEYAPISKERRRAIYRFMIFHELGHFLNGDFRTANIGDALLLGHKPFVFIAPALFLITLLYAVFAANFESTTIAAMLLGGGLIVFSVLVAAIKLFEYFRNEREQRADLRAKHSVNANDYQHVLGDALKIANLFYGSLPDLLVRQKKQSLLKKYLQWLDRLLRPKISTQKREATLAQQPSMVNLRQRMKFGVLLGSQLGILMVLAILLTIAFASLFGADISTSQTLALTMGLIICLPPSAHFIAATEPTRMRIITDIRAMISETVAVTFAIIVSAAIVTSASLFFMSWGIALLEIDTAEIGTVVLRILLFQIAAIATGCGVGSLINQGVFTGTKSTYGATMPWYASVAPFCIATFALIMPLCGFLFEYTGLTENWTGGVGVGAVVCFMPYFTLIILSNDLPVNLQKFIPIALPKVAEPVMLFRVGWTDFYVDCSDTPITVLVKNTLFYFLQMLFVLLLITAILVFSVWLNVGTSDEVMAGAIVFSIAGIFFSILIPAINRPNRSHLLSNRNLEIISRLGSIIDVNNPTMAEHARELANAVAKKLESNIEWENLMPNLMHPERLQDLVYLVRLLKKIGRHDLITSNKKIITARISTLFDDDGVVLKWPNGQPSLFWSACALKLDLEFQFLTISMRATLIQNITELLEKNLSASYFHNRAQHAFHNRTIFAAADALNRTDRKEDAMRAAAEILDFVASNGVRECGLSPAEINQCLIIADQYDVRIQSALVNTVQQQMWSLLHGNIHLNVIAAIDCINAMDDLNTTSENYPKMLRLLLDQIITVIAKTDIGNLRQASQAG